MSKYIVAFLVLFLVACGQTKYLNLDSSPEDDPSCGACEDSCTSAADCCPGEDVQCLNGKCWSTKTCGISSQGDSPRTSKLENLFRRFLEKALKEKHDDTPKYPFVRRNDEPKEVDMPYDY